MKKVYLYCDPRSINDATSYYVNIVSNVLCGNGYEYYVVHHLSDIDDPTAIFTITGKYFFKAKLRYPKCKTLFWAQGVSAEEAKMSVIGVKSFLRYLYRSITEPFAIRHCDLLFCVSERMVQYYKEKRCLLDERKCVVMPCYNLPLSDSFNLTQYAKPSFVYAGGFNVWQGVDFMLTVYSNIEKQLSNATLTILSSQKDLFEQAIKKYGIQRSEVKYVPLAQLQEELHKYKYGFIIRDDNIVNNVSTPTKMNSYLSNFVIPIFSDAVDSFVRHLDLGTYRIMINCPLDANSAANQIVNFEKTVTNFEPYERIVQSVFGDYYNNETYKMIITDLFTKIHLI